MGDVVYDKPNQTQDGKLKEIGKRMCKKCTITLRMCITGAGAAGTRLVEALAKATGCKVIAYTCAVRAGVVPPDAYVKSCEPNGKAKCQKDAEGGCGDDAKKKKRKPKKKQR